jgi:hypothetical protein
MPQIVYFVEYEELFMIETSRETLELFVEKAEELKKDYRGVIGIFRNVGEEEWQNYPEIRGFLLTFRLFILRRDGIALYVSEQGSLKRPELLELPSMSERWHEKVEQAYKWVTDALAIAPANLIYDSKSITRWEVLETFLYGKFAHMNVDKRQMFQRWQQMPDLFANLQFEFVSIVGFMFGQILDVAEASKQELGR